MKIKKWEMRCYKINFLMAFFVVEREENGFFGFLVIIFIAEHAGLVALVVIIGKLIKFTEIWWFNLKIVDHSGVSDKGVWGKTWTIFLKNQYY